MERVETLVTSGGRNAASTLCGSMGDGWSWKNPSSSKTVWEPKGDGLI